jgi:hypothetical protein
VCMGRDNADEAFNRGRGWQADDGIEQNNAATPPGPIMWFQKLMWIIEGARATHRQVS